MNNTIKILAFGIFIVFLLFDSAVSKAESTISEKNCAAQTHLNFRVVIPKSLYLQIGALQADAGFNSFSIKNKNEFDLSESDLKGLSVRAVGDVSKNGAMHLSSSISDPDDKKGKQPQKKIELIWSAGRVDRIGSADTQKENKNYSFSSTHLGHFTFDYSGKKDVRNPSPNTTHSYTLCSP